MNRAYARKAEGIAGRTGEHNSAGVNPIENIFPAGANQLLRATFVASFVTPTSNLAKEYHLRFSSTLVFESLLTRLFVTPSEHKLLTQV
jgi:hypothetical protein